MKPVINIYGGNVGNNGVGIGLPSSSDVELNIHGTNIFGNGVAILVQDKQIDVPAAVAFAAKLAFEQAIAGGASKEVAAEAVAQAGPVNAFLLANGVGLASLGVSAAQLLQAMGMF